MQIDIQMVQRSGPDVIGTLSHTGETEDGGATIFVAAGYLPGLAQTNPSDVTLTLGGETWSPQSVDVITTEDGTQVVTTA